MKMVKFVDTTTTAMVNIVASDKIMGIQTTDADTIVVTAEIVGALGTAGIDTGADKITITATAKAIVVAERLANAIAATNVGGASVLDVTSGNALFPEVSAVVYAAVV
jgi:hypothetical protein